MIAGLMILLLLLLLALGLPVAFVMGVSGAVGLLIFGGPQVVVGILSTSPMSTASTYELVTIPMFILMAEFVITSQIADEMFDTIVVWVGRVRGGLAIATAFAGAGFGAISGSSTAGAATLASTALPAMIRHGYNRKMANGVVAISGTLAMLIPPSVAAILYALVADQDLGKMLIAGIIPGILVALTIAATIVFLVWRHPDSAPMGKSYSLRDKFLSLKITGAMMFLILMVTGVIYLGVATPTEASSIGALSAFLIAWYRGRMTWAVFYRAVTSAARTSAMITMIIVGAHIFGYFMTITQYTQQFIVFIGGLNLHPYVILTIIIFLYIILGMFMDQIAILILTVPILLPLILSLGFDPIWFGILIILTAEVGMVTPPIGMNCFVVARYTGRPAEEVFIGVFPHVVAHVLLIVFIAAVPEIVLWLPSTM
ncbi:TRAP transporter large permease [bacterium]|nr:TRAP transporter large permease [bacterium]